ncbi:MAG: hypothetical protein GX776_01015 [Oxalobacter sp.]|nr:hypothetical protein [Oxalobacter sp.]
MTAGITWGHQEDDDYLGDSAKIAAFDMPNLWDPDNDPHPNTKVMNTLMDFGKRYINSDPTGGTGFTPTVLKPAQHDSGTYAPPSQQTNNQGLLANTEKPAISPSPAIKYASVKVPDMSKPTVTPYSSASSTSPFSANLTKTLGSIDEADTMAGSATGDLLGAIGGQYLKRGNHDVFEMPNRAEATFTGDLLGMTAKATGRAIINSGGDVAQHDSQTDYNLHHSQNPEAYRQQVSKTLNDAGDAWMPYDRQSCTRH